MGGDVLNAPDITTPAPPDAPFLSPDLRMAYAYGQLLIVTVTCLGSDTTQDLLAASITKWKQFHGLFHVSMLPWPLLGLGGYIP